jgi:hypothetical protein
MYITCRECKIRSSLYKYFICKSDCVPQINLSFEYSKVKYGVIVWSNKLNTWYCTTYRADLLFFENPIKVS